MRTVPAQHVGSHARAAAERSTDHQADASSEATVGRMQAGGHGAGEERAICVVLRRRVHACAQMHRLSVPAIGRHQASHVLVRDFTARRIASAICSGEWSTPWSFSAGAFRRERKREGKRRWRLSTCEPRCRYGAHRRFRIPLLSPVLPSPQRLVCPEAGAKNGPKP